MSPEAVPFFSATSQVLSTSELLEYIIGSGDHSQNDLLNWATVSRFWSEVALNSLWSTVSSLDVLLRILPSVEQVGNGHGCVWMATGRGIIHPDHWKRFLFYSKRIRSLQVNTCGTVVGTTHDMSASLLSDMAFPGPPVVLFPSLKSLVWAEDYCSDAAWVRFSILFLNYGISSLSIRLPREPWMAKRTTMFLQEIIVRCPNISTLDIDSFHSLSTYGITSELAYLLTQLPRLVSVTVPLSYLKSDLMSAAAELPKLEVLDMVGTTWRMERLESILADPYWKIHVENPFPSLRRVSIQNRIRMIDQLLHAVSNKHSLTHLSASLTDYTDLSLLAFLQGLSKECPALEYLTIARDFMVLFPSDTSKLPSLGRATLEPVKMLRRLKQLHITYYNPSEITDDDFMELIEALPNLSKLELKCKPVTIEHPSLTLRVLQRLSSFYHAEPQTRHRTKLTHLTIHVDASEWPDDTIGDFLSTTDIYPLDTLSNIVIQPGPISSVNPVALYLSRLVSPGAKLYVACDGLPLGFYPENNPNCEEVVRVMDDRTKKWNEALSLQAQITAVIPCH